MLPAAAQRGEDFASRYMALYGDRAALACKTISPAMMERIMKLDTVRHDAGTRRVFAQLRSIRFVTAPDTALTRQLYAQAYISCVMFTMIRLQSIQPESFQPNDKLFQFIYRCMEQTGMRHGNQRPSGL